MWLYIGKSPLSTSKTIDKKDIQIIIRNVKQTENNYINKIIFPYNSYLTFHLTDIPPVVYYLISPQIKNDKVKSIKCTKKSPKRLIFTF